MHSHNAVTILVLNFCAFATHKFINEISQSLMSRIFNIKIKSLNKLTHDEKSISTYKVIISFCKKFKNF